MDVHTLYIHHQEPNNIWVMYVQCTCWHVLLSITTLHFQSGRISLETLASLSSVAESALAPLRLLLAVAAGEEGESGVWAAFKVLDASDHEELAMMQAALDSRNRCEPATAVLLPHCSTLSHTQCRVASCRAESYTTCSFCRCCLDYLWVCGIWVRAVQGRHVCQMLSVWSAKTWISWIQPNGISTYTVHTCIFMVHTITPFVHI
jgi:hypothetical protein